MYNVRYHIASLVGVFLALALGLVLGGLVVQRGAVDRQQTTLVSGLRKEFATLRADNEKLAAENTVLEEFSADMADAWVADRLVGKNVVVLTGVGRTDGVDAATRALGAAGATVVTVTLVEEEFGLQDAELRSTITSQTYSDELVESVAASLAAEWAEPATEHPVTEALAARGAIVVEGLEPGMAFVGMVGAAVRGGEPDQAGLELASQFSRLGQASVIAESASVPSGLAVAGSRRELPAFNTLGTAIGRYTVVSLLTGGRPGLYGTMAESTASYPDLPEK